MKFLRTLLTRLTIWTAACIAVVLIGVALMLGISQLPFELLRAGAGATLVGVYLVPVVWILGLPAIGIYTLLVPPRLRQADEASVTR